jgi:hypothetical protein
VTRQNCLPPYSQARLSHILRYGARVLHLQSKLRRIYLHRGHVAVWLAKTGSPRPHAYSQANFYFRILGHCYCLRCLDRHCQLADRPCCPDCRRPYFRRDITRLFIDFDRESEPEIPALQELEPNIEADPPPMTLTQEQRDEAASITTCMSVLGVDSSSDVLVYVLDDIKRWCNGVEAIKDLETRVCIF